MKPKQQELNQINELTVSANYLENAMTGKHGTITLGNRGLEYNNDLGGGFIQIPYEEIRQVRVQIVFGFYYRGFYIDTKDGHSFNFVVSKTKKAIHVLNRKLSTGIMHSQRQKRR